MELARLLGVVRKAARPLEARLVLELVLELLDGFLFLAGLPEDCLLYTSPSPRDSKKYLITSSA